MGILNTPFNIKDIELRSRLVMPPMATAKAAEDGRVTGRLCDYYAGKSKGGQIGLIITEHSYISQEGKASVGQMSITEDGDVAGLKELVAAIHQNHTMVVAQINHAGGAARKEVTGCEALSASSVRIPRAAAPEALPREMGQEDIRKVTADFARAAGRAKAAGFDGVEIHSAHGYLLNQFFSPLTNRRRDGYAGTSIDGRIRLHLEIIDAVRQAVGDRYLIALRLGACDYMEGGITLEDSVLAAPRLEEAGLDILDISGGFCGYVRPGATEQGYFSGLSEAIKKKVRIPVLLTGGIVDAGAAEALLGSHKADLIGVGRAILKNPDWTRQEAI